MKAKLNFQTSQVHYLLLLATWSATAAADKEVYSIAPLSGDVNTEQRKYGI